MRKPVVGALIVAFAAIAACGARREDPGPTVSRNYQIGDFHGIEVAGPYDVTVRTGANPSVSATGGEALLARTTVEVQDGKLVIGPKDKRNFHFSRGGKATFTVTVPQLDEAAIAGSGDIRVDHAQGDRFKGAVAGSGNLEIGQIDVAALEFAIGGSGSVSGGKGKAQMAEYSIAGSGDLDAAGVRADRAKVSIAGSGNVRAQATGLADVSIMGSGDVEVTGGAKCSVNKSGSGSVSCS